MTKSALNSIEIPLPSHEMQVNIVALLDKAQSLINKRKEQIQACDELIKSEVVGTIINPILLKIIFFS